MQVLKSFIIQRKSYGSQFWNGWTFKSLVSDVADARSWCIFILVIFFSSVFSFVAFIRGVGGGSMRDWTSEFSRLLFLIFIMLVAVGATRSDFTKFCTCLTMLILKTHSNCCLRNFVGIDVYRLIIFTIYYDPAPPPYKVVENSIYPHVCSIFTTRKGVFISY